METPKPSVLVTGAGNGIGRAIALVLAKHGYHLICWSRTEENLVTLKQEINKLGTTCIIQSIDLGDHVKVKESAKYLSSQIQSLDAVIVNAGEGVWRNIPEYSPETWNREINSNLTGAFYTISETLSLLLKSRKKILIGIGSDASIYSFPRRAAYSASKSGMVSLLESLRREYRSQGLRVSILHPSAVDTNFKGSYEQAGVGTRQKALNVNHLASLVLYIMSSDPSVEFREIQIGSIKVPYGPYEESYGESENE